MIINDLDDYYIVFDTKNRNTELDTLIVNAITSKTTKLQLGVIPHHRDATHRLPSLCRQFWFDGRIGE